MTATQSTVITPGIYEIQAGGSSVRLRAAHAFGLGPVAVTMTVVEGAVVVEGPDRCRVTATIDAASFTTDKTQRDAKVRSKTFLDTRRYPLMSFAGADLAPAADGGWRLRGELTVRGVAAPVELTVREVHPVDGGLRCRAGARVDRYAFGVTAGRGLIRRYLDVELTVLATSASRAARL
jgi:polyisoprenoid-binding protein YceI